MPRRRRAAARRRRDRPCPAVVARPGLAQADGVPDGPRGREAVAGEHDESANAKRPKLVEDALSLGADAIFCADGTGELAVETHQQGRLSGGVEAFENSVRLVG